MAIPIRIDIPNELITDSRIGVIAIEAGGESISVDICVQNDAVAVVIVWICAVVFDNTGIEVGVGVITVVCVIDVAGWGLTSDRGEEVGSVAISVFIEIPSGRVDRLGLVDTSVAVIVGAIANFNPSWEGEAIVVVAVGVVLGEAFTGVFTINRVAEGVAKAVCVRVDKVCFAVNRVFIDQVVAVVVDPITPFEGIRPNVSVAVIAVALIRREAVSVDVILVNIRIPVSSGLSIKDSIKSQPERVNNVTTSNRAYNRM